jgi:hypothetical protein
LRTLECKIEGWVRLDERRLARITAYIASGVGRSAETRTELESQDGMTHACPEAVLCGQPDSSICVT